jgi:phosphate-selective porin OprO/OprP
MIRQNAMRRFGRVAAAAFTLMGGHALAAAAPEGCRPPLLYCGEDDGLRIAAIGRLQVDQVSQSDASGRNGWTKPRTARLGVQLQTAGGMQARAEHEFAARPGWRNVWLRTRLGRRAFVRAGNFVAPFSLEALQSSTAMPFVERSLAQALAPVYGLGGEAGWRRGGWTLTGGWFEDALKNDDGTRARRGRGLVARATYAPLNTADDLVHLGLAVEHRTTDRGYGLRIQTRPEAAFVPDLIHSRGLTQASGFTSLGGEAVLAHKSVLVQGQLMETRVTRETGPATTLKGGYVQAAWILTGQRRAYSRTSAMPGPVDLAPGRGAIEIAARFSTLDLRGPAAPGGVARDLTLGANWYVNRQVRLMADYIRAWAQSRPGASARTADIVALRLQAKF